MNLTNVITVARREVGYTEEKGNLTKYGKWFGLNGVSWCGIFVSWCYAKGGVKLPQRSFRGISPRPLETEGCGLVTFPEYGWATIQY